MQWLTKTPERVMAWPLVYFPLIILTVSVKYRSSWRNDFHSYPPDLILYLNRIHCSPEARGYIIFCEVHIFCSWHGFSKSCRPTWCMISRTRSPAWLSLVSEQKKNAPHIATYTIHKEISCRNVDSIEDKNIMNVFFYLSILSQFYHRPVRKT